MSTCKDCRFANIGAGYQFGSCRRDAPAPGKGAHLSAEWPTIHEDYWCGEFELRSPGALRALRRYREQQARARKARHASRERERIYKGAIGRIMYVALSVSCDGDAPIALDTIRHITASAQCAVDAVE